MRDVKKLGVDAYLNIVGDGPERVMWEKKARQEHLPVTFLGRLAPAELKSVLERSQVFIQPSTKESFGIAALEARANGLAVVARRGTGTQTFIADGTDGRVCDSDSGMALAIKDWDINRNSLHTILEHNAQVPPKYSWSEIDDRVRAAYQRAIAKAQ
jgi:glycosyltransferase involved in cell wall biosynthesis